MQHVLRDQLDTLCREAGIGKQVCIGVRVIKPAGKTEIGEVLLPLGFGDDLVEDGEDTDRVAFAAHLQQDATAGAQAAVQARDNRAVVLYPVQRCI